MSGEVTAIVGVNGVGKSTLLRTLAALQNPLSGEVWLEGVSMAKLSPAERALRLSVVLTDRSMPGNIEGEELVMLGRHPHTGWSGKPGSDDHQIVERALRFTNAESYSKRKIGELSDGQRQRIMIARAIAQDTPIILLDEPTAHLDVPGRVQIFQLLQRLAREQNKAILIASHQLDLALRFADQLWLLQSSETPICKAPEDLILEGHLARAFAREGLNFDSHSGALTVELQAARPVLIEGPELPRYWTGNALRRLGFQLIDDGDADLRILIEAGDNGPTWQFQQGAKKGSARSVHALVKLLRDQ